MTTPEILNRQHFHRGDRIFQAGDAANCAYLIQAGGVDIVTGDRVLGTLQAGDIFGEMALVDNAPRSADAIAREPTTCVVITRPQFQRRLDKADPFIRALLTLMTKRLRRQAEGGR